MTTIIDYPITSRFGERDSMHLNPHTGIDLATPTGTKIYSQDSGKVSIKTDYFLGNSVRLKLDNGMIIVYGHLSKVNVSEGQYAGVGEYLGETGGVVGSVNSGLTSGPHIHISVYNSSGTLVDPMPYLFEQQQYQDISSPLIFPIMLILLLIGIWKAKRFLFYGLGIFGILLIIFLSLNI